MSILGSALGTGDFHLCNKPFSGYPQRPDPGYLLLLLNGSSAQSVREQILTKSIHQFKPINTGLYRNTVR